MLENNFAEAIALTNNGKIKEAVKVCAQILADNPDHLDAIQMKAIHSYRLGDKAEAISLLKIAADKHLKNFNLQLNLGELYSLSLDFNNAEAYFNKALIISPDLPITHYNLGKMKLKQKLGYESIRYFQKVLSIEPKNASAHYQLGHAHLMIGDQSAAISAFEQALVFNPNDDKTVSALAKIHKDSKNYTASIKLLDDFLSRNPQNATAWFEKGQTHRRKSELKPAFDALNRAQQLAPDNPEILQRFAELLSELGKTKDAIVAYQKAVRLAPDDPETLNNYGGLLLENKQYEKAIPLLEKSARINPKNQSAFINLGLCYESIGDTPSGVKLYDKIRNRLAANDLFTLHIDTLCPVIAESNTQIDNFRKDVMATLDRFDQDFSMEIRTAQLDRSYAMPSYNMTYQGRNDREIKSAWGRFYEKRIEPVVLGAKNQKPKIGFLVTQSHEGVFIKDAAGIIKNLDANKFDLVVLANGVDALEPIGKFINRAEVSYVSFSRKLPEAVREITALNFDFLYYWEVGSDLLNYFLPYYQLARIQISSWGSAFTSGNPRIQSYWSSRWLENANYQNHYSEEVVLFENLPTHYYRIKKPEGLKTRRDFGLPEDKNIYLCAQSIIKAHPDFDELLRGILVQDDQALVCFLSPKQQELKKSLLRRFQSSLPKCLHRIRFLARLPHQDYLELMRLADVCIDPPHYSGANTTYEALQAGTPVVSLPGQYQRGKYTEAIYKIIGLDEFIPADAAQYIDLAVRIANDPHLKQRIIEAHDAKAKLLFEQKGIINEIETFLLEKFEEY